MTFTVTYRGVDGAVRTEADEAAGRGECVSLDWLRPCGRAGYRAPFRRLERFGKAASLCESLRNVAIECRVAAKFVADAGLRIEDNHGVPSRISHDTERWREVGIPRNENECICFILVSILQKFGRDVDICQLLRDLRPTYESRMADESTSLARTFRRFKSFHAHSIVALKYLHAPAGQGIKIFVLPLCSMMTIGFINHARCEILNLIDAVFWQKKLLGECLKIKPFVCGMSKQSIVEVASIDIYDCSLNCHKKMLGPWRTKAPRRLPESWRVKTNLLKGSAHIVANRGCGCNGGDARFFSVQFFRRAA